MEGKPGGIGSDHQVLRLERPSCRYASRNIARFSSLVGGSLSGDLLGVRLHVYEREGSVTQFSPENLSGVCQRACPAFALRSLALPSGKVNLTWLSVRNTATDAGRSCARSQSRRSGPHFRRIGGFRAREHESRSPTFSSRTRCNPSGTQLSYKWESLGIPAPPHETHSSKVLAVVMTALLSSFAFCSAAPLGLSSTVPQVPSELVE